MSAPPAIGDRKSKIGISLVVGFLGSGKTTLLGQLLARRPARQRWACVVNEFGPVHIDGQRLAGTGAQIIPVPGGSIFCHCLVTEFIRVLRDLARSDPGLDAVLIEASGVADPRSVGRMLGETGLDGVYAMASVLAVVDPGTYLKLRQTLPAVQAQIEAADHLVLNKVDCHPEERLREVEALLRQTNPRASLHRCSFGRIEFDPLLGAADLTGPQAPVSPNRDPAFAVCQVIHEASVDENRLREAVDRIAEHLFRLKGQLRFHGRMQCVDYDRTGLVVRPDVRTGARPELVAIYRSEAEEELRRVLLRPLVQGEFDET